jgi:hypothetical protein
MDSMSAPVVRESLDPQAHQKAHQKYIKSTKKAGRANALSAQPT